MLEKESGVEKKIQPHISRKYVHDSGLNIPWLLFPAFFCFFVLPIFLVFSFVSNFHKFYFVSRF